MTETSYANHLLIAMPSLKNTFFEKAVVYVCEHHPQGTVGLIINRPMIHPLGMVFEQLQIDQFKKGKDHLPLLYGGPIQPERGFVIHRPVGGWRSSLFLQDDVTVTTSNDIIRAIAEDMGPKDALVTLGYSGWLENQLMDEVMKNTWLICPYKPELLYDVPFDKRWAEAGLMLGVKMDQLISDAGHA